MEYKKMTKYKVNIKTDQAKAINPYYGNNINVHIKNILYATLSNINILKDLPSKEISFDKDSKIEAYNLSYIKDNKNIVFTQKADNNNFKITFLNMKEAELLNLIKLSRIQKGEFNIFDYLEPTYKQVLKIKS